MVRTPLRRRLFERTERTYAIDFVPLRRGIPGRALPSPPTRRRSFKTCAGVKPYRWMGSGGRSWTRISPGYLDYRYRPYADGGMGANKEADVRRRSGGVRLRRRRPVGRAGRLEHAAAGTAVVRRQRSGTRRTSTTRASPARRQFVWFGAANYHAIVFLNGKKLGEHVGGFTPFQFEVTGLLRDKGNFLIVKVDDRAPCRGRADPDDRLVELWRADARA